MQPTDKDLSAEDQNVDTTTPEVNPEELINEVEDQAKEEEKAETGAENENPENEKAKLQAELTEVKDKYLRLSADFDNYRKRMAKERADLILTANQQLLSSLLPVLDDFERAQKSISSAEKQESKTQEELTRELEALKTGVQLVHQKFVKMLESQGLKPMESPIGQVFDLDKHESITQIPAPSEELKGKVVDEIEKGYYLNDKVIRFAKVVVGS